MIPGMNNRRHFLRTSAAVGAAFLGLKQLTGCATPAFSPEPAPELVKDPDTSAHHP